MKLNNFMLTFLVASMWPITQAFAGKERPFTEMMSAIQVGKMVTSVHGAKSEEVGKFTFNREVHCATTSYLPIDSDIIISGRPISSIGARFQLERDSRYLGDCEYLPVRGSSKDQTYYIKANKIIVQNGGQSGPTEVLFDREIDEPQSPALPEGGFLTVDIKNKLVIQLTSKGLSLTDLNRRTRHTIFDPSYDVMVFIHPSTGDLILFIYSKINLDQTALLKRVASQRIVPYFRDQKLINSQYFESFPNIETELNTLFEGSERKKLIPSIRFEPLSETFEVGRFKKGSNYLYLDVDLSMDAVISRKESNNESFPQLIVDCESHSTAFGGRCSDGSIYVLDGSAITPGLCEFDSELQKNEEICRVVPEPGTISFNTKFEARMSLNNAIEYCENLIFGGKTDWELADKSVIWKLLNQPRSGLMERYGQYWAPDIQGSVKEWYQVYWWEDRSDKFIFPTITRRPNTGWNYFRCQRRTH